MIQIAAENQSVQGLLNEHLSDQLSSVLLSNLQPANGCSAVAFIGYFAWRRNEVGDANLSDEQVFVVRDGQVKLLDPKFDLEKFSPDGLSWGYTGSGTAQLAIALLMEVFGDWERVKKVWPEFHDRFVAKIPRNANWVADGANILAIALEIESAERLNLPNHVALMITNAEFHDGKATLPAYLLEQLADAAGVEIDERHYTEPSPGRFHASAPGHADERKP